MTAPVEIPASIEHLDCEPKCFACGQAATRWWRQHECWDGFFCGSCADRNLVLLTRHLISGGVLECTVCHCDFTSMDDLAEVVSL